MRVGGVPEFDDARVALECLLHDAPLDSAAAPMNQADLAESSFPRRIDVLVDDRSDVARSKRVKIERVFDGDLHVRAERTSKNRFAKRRLLGDVGGRDDGFDPSTDRKIPGHGHPARLAYRDQVIEDL